MDPEPVTVSEARAVSEPDMVPEPVAGSQTRRRPLLTVFAAVACLCCLAVAALAAAVAARWRSWPAGRIFPVALGYTTTLRGRETARRIGISPDYRCAAALDTALAGPAREEGCRAGIRASYVDELDGVIYTTGVLAFPDRARAGDFTRRLSSSRPPTTATHALALPGEGGARFTAAARQSATARQDGPYVLLTVAGYADGRPAAATGEYDAAAFSAAGQLSGEILTPLNRAAVVNCARRQWSC